MPRKFNVYKFLLEKIKCKYIVQNIITLANNDTVELIIRRKNDVKKRCKNGQRFENCRDLYKSIVDINNKNVVSICRKCKNFEKDDILKFKICSYCLCNIHKNTYQVLGVNNHGVILGYICIDCINYGFLNN